ncbi:hypothetical protein KXS07_09350 [Inquilinus limosus]|uniref:calcium-binding protein n=1 Tax=Inquilinus limosus TaxID=171674 RepID=UPI003F171250
MAVINGTAGNDNLPGTADADTISGLAGNDILTGLDGDDVLIGGLGADALNGGAGSDTADYSGEAAAIAINLAVNFASGAATGDTFTSIENLIGTNFNDELASNDSANTVDGGAGNDIIYGSLGADTLIGGVGIDTIWYNTAPSGVTVDLAAGTGSGGWAEGDTLSGFERIGGSDFDDDLSGDAGANEIAGGLGNDIVQGRGGADLVDGREGFDWASYRDSSAAVVVNLLAGTASGGDAQGDTLAAIEGVIGSAQSDTLTGNGIGNNLQGLAGNDTIDGGGADDFLVGGAGADQINGGAGIADIADYADSSAGVTVDLTAGTGVGGDAQGDTLTGVEYLNGSAFADRLYGDAAGNQLRGGDGDDTLRGGAGADLLVGGAGSDFVNYQGSAAAVTVNLQVNQGFLGDAQGDVLQEIENIYGSSNNDNLIGNDNRNILGGELGNDTLTGNGGDDSLSGEAGDDTINGGDGNDRAVGGAGVDTIRGGIGNDSIDAGSENDTVFGDAGNDSIVGGAGIDQIDGGDGNDVIQGGDGADALTGGTGVDTAYYSLSAVGVTVNLTTGTGTGGDAQGDTLTGIEQVFGSNAADVLTGDAGNNTLWGSGGNDVLTGGLGADVLKGGAGNDSFVYTDVAESTVAIAGKDLITDFSTGDRIDLSAIDADGNATNGNTAFSFGTGNFTGAGAEVRVVAFGDGRQGVYLDVNGDRNPDAIVSVYSDHALTAADFVL